MNKLLVAQLCNDCDYDMLQIDDESRLPIINGVICDESKLDSIKQYVKSYKYDSSISIASIKSCHNDQQFIKRVSADRSSNRCGNSLITRTDINLFIVDTGINRRAEINLVGGFNSSGGDVKKYNDNNGHGTHVAGIAGGSHIGVVPGVRLWGVKVADNGTGSLTTILKGLDWILKSRDNAWKGYGIVNVSMSGSYNEYIDQAVERLCKAGIVVCVAAGNYGIDASNLSPARVDLAITVGATANCNYNSIAPYSNHGKVIDILAPGSGIYSLHKGNSYSVISGTSMACPIVSSTIALMISSGRNIPKGEQLVKEIKKSLINLSSRLTSINYDKSTTSNSRIVLTEKAKRSGTTDVSVKTGCF